MNAWGWERAEQADLTASLAVAHKHRTILNSQASVSRSLSALMFLLLTAMSVCTFHTCMLSVTCVFCRCRWSCCCFSDKISAITPA